MHFHYFLVTLSLMFRKLDISLFLCIWNFCVLCFFNVEFGYPRSVGLSGTLRLAFGKKLFGKGGTRSSQRSQESDTARWWACWRDEVPHLRIRWSGWWVFIPAISHHCDLGSQRHKVHWVLVKQMLTNTCWISVVNLKSLDEFWVLKYVGRFF